MSVIDDLLALSAGDVVLAETEAGEQYRFRVDEIEYVEPDEYGAGHLEVSIEFDAEFHGVPTDELPEESGLVVARRADSDSLGRPKLSVRAPYLEEHSGRRVENWDTLGWIESVAVVEEK